MLTPSTACTAPTVRWNTMPRVIGKCLTRSLASTVSVEAAVGADSGHVRSRRITSCQKWQALRPADATAFTGGGGSGRQTSCT